MSDLIFLLTIYSVAPNIIYSDYSGLFWLSRIWLFIVRGWQGIYKLLLSWQIPHIFHTFYEKLIQNFLIPIRVLKVFRINEWFLCLIFVRIQRKRQNSLLESRTDWLWLEGRVISCIAKNNSIVLIISKMILFLNYELIILFIRLYRHQIIIFW